MEIPKRILEVVELVSSYAGDTNDWVRIKREIMNQLPWKLRTNFSRRDQKTKKQWLNDFDRAIISKYKELTGIQLEIIEKEKEINT